MNSDRPCPGCGRLVRSVAKDPWCHDCPGRFSELAEKAAVTGGTPAVRPTWSGPVLVTFPWAALVSVNNRCGGMVGWTSKEWRDGLNAMRTLAAAQVKCAPTEGPVRLTVHYHPPDRRHLDAHNNDKAIMDSLQGLVYADDAQVVEWHGHKYPPSADPRAVVEVEVIAAETAA